jgi:hypothetical protein
MRIRFLPAHPFDHLVSAEQEPEPWRIADVSGGSDIRFAAGRLSAPESLSRWILILRRMAMPQFVIEREMPGVGKLSQNDLKAASQGSCKVIRELGPEIQWVHSYVTDDKIYCVYRAPSEDLIRKHAETAGFPANSIARVRATIDPTSAE